MRKESLWKKRGMALVMAAALAATSVPFSALAKSSVEGNGATDVQMEKASPSSEDILADFDFDDEAGGFEGGSARASGSYTLTDGYDGKALYLDGSASNYLTVTNLDGGSLLTGLDELTISYEMKPDRTGTNWVMYAAPDGGTQNYLHEKYLGIMESGGTTTAERYLNAGARPASASTSTGSDWHHVDVVVTKEDTAIYVNGVEKSRVESAYAVEDILGTNSILCIGKANWGSGEYFKGWIDNFKIYDKAYSQDELPQVSGAFAKMVLEQTADSIQDITLDSGIKKLPDYSGMVTWRSNLSNVEIGEDGLTAKITQPEIGEEAVTGTITAVLSYGGQQMEKTVQVTIQPKIEASADYGYLMVHFIENSAGYCEKIYLDISRGDDPEQWDPLNEGEPILASHLGTTGVRDPYLTYNPETETYYIIATDLRVFGGDNAGWGAWQKSYSTKMNVWESKDLITWSDVRQFDVALDAEGNEEAELGMMWAPEATWVPDYYGEGRGAFVVYWSSTMYKDTDPNHDESVYSKILWGATTDFTQATYEYGGVFLENSGQGYIDTTMIQDGDKTYHITKYTGSDSIVMQSTEEKEWWKEGTRWTTIQSDIGKSRFGSVEGPAVFKNHSQDHSWYLFVDDLPQPGYQPMASNDLDQGWEYLDSPDYFLTKNTKHGGVISLTKGQYDAIRNADAVSAVKEDLGTVKIGRGWSEQELQNLLKEELGKAQVNLAYDMGTSELPVSWDVTGVNLTQAGSYPIEGVVQSISANKDQWVGKDGSTDYNAQDRRLYSSRAITVTAQVEVAEDAQVMEVEEIIRALPEPEQITEGQREEVVGAYNRYMALSEEQKALVSQEAKDKLLAAYEKITQMPVTPPEEEKPGDVTPPDNQTQTPQISVGAVTGLKLKPAASSVKLTWNGTSGADGYRIYRYDKAARKYVQIGDVKKTSYTDKKRKSAQAYQYQVCAYKKDGERVVTGAVCQGKTLTKPAVPKKVKAKRLTKAGKSTKASISFKKVTGVKRYAIDRYDAKKKKYVPAFQVRGKKLYRYQAKSGKYKKVNRVKMKKGIITCTLTKLNLKSQKKQKYRVRAVAVKSGYSAQYGKYGKTVIIK